MTSKSTFNSISQTLIDNWLDATSPIEDPEAFCGTISDTMSLKMSLNFIDTKSDDPLDWYFRRIKPYGINSRILNLKKMFPDGPLRNLPDRTYLLDAVIPHYSRALSLRKPLIDLVLTKIAGINVGYDRLLVPQKTNGRAEWCVSFTEGRFLFKAPVDAKLDPVDEVIIQLLMEGETAREIAVELGLSQRTIEHRIDKMKIRYEARNVVHLTAKLFSIHMDRRMAEDRIIDAGQRED